MQMKQKMKFVSCSVALMLCLGLGLAQDYGKGCTKCWSFGEA